MPDELKLVETEDLTPKGRRRLSEICRLATKALSEKGYWPTTMTDIAQATGVSKGGLYHYFQTKEQLLYVIIQRYIDLMLDGLAEEAAAIESPRDRIIFLIRRHIRLYTENVYESRLMFHDMHLLPPNLFKVIVEKSREYRKIWTDAVVALAAGRGVSASETNIAALTLLGMCNWIYLWYEPGGPISAEELTEQISGIFLNGFGRQPDID